VTVGWTLHRNEAARRRHGVSADASEMQPAKLLAVLVVDTNETKQVIPFGN